MSIAVANLGYKLIDLWDDTTGSCIVPFHPETSVHVYTGLYFTNVPAA